MSRDNCGISIISNGSLESSGNSTGHLSRISQISSAMCPSPITARLLDADADIHVLKQPTRIAVDEYFEAVRWAHQHPIANLHRDAVKFRDLVVLECARPHRDYQRNLALEAIFLNRPVRHVDSALGHAGLNVGHGQHLAMQNLVLEFAKRPQMRGPRVDATKVRPRDLARFLDGVCLRHSSPK